MKYFNFLSKNPAVSLGLMVLPIIGSLNAQGALEFYPQNSANSNQNAINPTLATKGSEYYTLPKSDDNTETNADIHISQNPRDSQVYNPHTPNNDLYQIPDRVIPPASKSPVVTTKIPSKSQIAGEPVAPINNPKQNTATKNTASKPSAVKEKIVPTVKKVNLKFSDFPAKFYTGKRVAPNLASLKNLNSFYGETLNEKGEKGEKQFVQTVSKAKPNYAGHYVITNFACGLNCTAAVAYDMKTGDFMELGGGFADCPATDFNPRQKASITHQANSRLLIVIGATSSGNCIAGYFEEKNGNVSLISQKNLMTYVP